MLILAISCIRITSNEAAVKFDEQRLQRIREITGVVEVDIRKPFRASFKSKFLRNQKGTLSEYQKKRGSEVAPKGNKNASLYIGQEV